MLLIASYEDAFRNLKTARNIFVSDQYFERFTGHPHCMGNFSTERLKRDSWANFPGHNGRNVCPFSNRLRNWLRFPWGYATTFPVFSGWSDDESDKVKRHGFLVNGRKGLVAFTIAGNLLLSFFLFWISFFLLLFPFFCRQNIFFFPVKTKRELPSSFNTYVYRLIHLKCETLL